MIPSIDPAGFDQFIRNFSAAIGIAITVGLIALLGTRMLIHEMGKAVSPALGHILDGLITFLLIVFVAVVAVRFHVLA